MGNCMQAKLLVEHTVTSKTSVLIIWEFQIVAGIRRPGNDKEQGNIHHCVGQKIVCMPVTSATILHRGKIYGGFFFLNISTVNLIAKMSSTKQ